MLFSIISRARIFLSLLALSALGPSHAEQKLGRDDITFYYGLPSILRGITTIDAGPVIAINGQTDSFKSVEMAPKNTYEVILIVKHMREHPDRKLIVGAGNFKNIYGAYQGLSVDGHAQGMKGDIYLSTKNLKTRTLTQKNYRIDPKKNTIALTVRGGTSWGEALKLANSTLSPEEKKLYRYFPLAAPTTHRVSLAGSLASHTMARTSAFGGGFMPDAVESFEIVTLQNGEVKKLFASRDVNADIFFGLPGSFRIGIITKITITLQRVPRNMRVVTRVKKYKDIYKLVEDFNNQIAINQDMMEYLDESQRAFNSVYVTATDRGRFYLYSSRLSLKSESKGLPRFQFYERPSLMTSIIQGMGHSQTRLANRLVDMVNTGPRGMISYQSDLESFMFPQESYLTYLRQYPKARKTFRFLGSSFEGDQLKLAQQAYILPKDNLLHSIEIAKSLQRELYKSHGIVCKMEDIVPLPSSKFLMTPSYGVGKEFFVYTFTWPVRSRINDEGIKLFREKFLRRAAAHPGIGPGMVKPHMLKEFDQRSTVLYDTYGPQIAELNAILKKHDIDDSFLWNRIIGTLYQITRN